MLPSLSVVWDFEDTIHFFIDIDGGIQYAVAHGDNETWSVELVTAALKPVPWKTNKINKYPICGWDRKEI